VRARYGFLTTWLLDAPREAVWEVIHEIERWPEWWRGVERVEKLRGGDEDGVGSVHAQRWRSALPYTVSFQTETTVVERPLLLEARATGELEGLGRWRFHEGAATAVTYEWNVRTTRPWMNALAPVGRPVFAWSHNLVMAWGGECVAHRLGARLLAQS
jgi:hypothetical protein